MNDLPRARFAHLPTPLEDAPRLAASLGVEEMLVKREDLCGLACGGNKTRLMEYVMGDVLQRGVDAVVAAASQQSNKLREVAAAAARHGLRCVLLVDGERPAEPPQGNMLLFDLLGAEVRFGVGGDVLAAQRAVQAELEQAGHRAAVLDRLLAYGALATAAYVDAASELIAQLASRRVDPDWIVITAGAGMTIAGLVLGLRHHGMGTKVLGVSVSRPAAAVVPDILEHAARAADLLGITTRVGESEITVIDGARPGYGQISADIAETIRLVAGHHGMVLDPVYNAKTMRGLIEQVGKGVVAHSDRVVFVNTGGAPALFAHHVELSSPSPETMYTIVSV